MTFVTGTHRLVAAVTDSSGRETNSAEVVVTVVHPPGTVTVTSPADGSTVRGGSLALTVDAAVYAAGATIAQVDFFTSWGGLLGSDTTAPYGVTWDIGTVTGSRGVYANVVESSGRRWQSRVVSVTVANTFPKVMVTGPATIQDPVPLTVTGTAVPGAADAPPVDRVVVTVAGSPAGTVTVDADGTWRVPWDATGRPGYHYVVATAYDTTGARSVTQHYLHVRKPVPTLTVLAPEPGTVVHGDGTVDLEVRPQAGDHDAATFVEVCFRDRYHGYVSCVVPGADGVARHRWTAHAPSGEQKLTVDLRMSDGHWFSFTGPSFVIARPPPPPDHVTVAPGLDGTATVSWPAMVTSEPAPVEGYVVTASPGGQTKRVAAAPVTFTGLANGVEHTFSVAAYNTVGTGVTESAKGTPGTPTDVRSAVFPPETATAGSTVTIAGTLVGNGVPLAGVVVELVAAPTGLNQTSRLARTSSTGRVTFSYVVTRHTSLALVFRGSGRYLEGGFGSTVRVRAKLTSALSASSVPLGTTVSLRGTVTPARTGGFVYIQRYYGGAWHTGTYRTMSSTGAVSIPVKMSRGTYTYRLYYRGSTYASAGYSLARTLKVS